MRAAGQAAQHILERPSASTTTRRAPSLAGRSGSRGLGITSISCGPIHDIDPQSLGVTYWLDTEPIGDPYTVSVHLKGRRQSAKGGTAAEFTRVTTFGPVVPGSGPISVTTRVTDLEPGIWDVSATPVNQVGGDGSDQWEVKVDPLMPAAHTSGSTLFAPFNTAVAPGVIIGAWPALVTLGAALGVTLQAVLAGRLGLPTGRITALTVIACLLGVLGAKTYYLFTHPEEKKRILTSGMSVQGFVITVALSLLLGSWALSIPTASLFDASAPGLLLGMAVGRLGCLLGGCCVGRPTASRWGLWSSDRRTGARRIPVQLLESGTALLLCGIATTTVVRLENSGGGLVFVGAIATYIAARQVLFPLRDLPRATAHGRQLTLGASVLVALAASALLLR